MNDRVDVVEQRELALRAVPDAAPEAREALRALLRGTPFEGRLDDGELALSELVVAVSAGQPRVDLTLTLQRDDAELVRDFTHAVDEADRLSRAGALLTTPARPELSAARQSSLRRLLSQRNS